MARRGGRDGAPRWQGWRAEVAGMVQVLHFCHLG
jgi:hypothetical protein